MDISCTLASFRPFWKAGRRSKERTLKYQLTRANNDDPPSVGPTVTNTIPRIVKRKISKSYWSCHTIGLAVPRLSSPRGSREASKRTSDKKLTDRSGKLLSTRLGGSQDRLIGSGLEGFSPKKPYIENRWDLT